MQSKVKLPVAYEVQSERFVFKSKVDDKEVPVKAFNSAKLFLGEGEASKKTSVSFFVDIGYQGLFIGDLKAYGNGIQCDDPKVNSCEQNLTENNDLFRFSKQFKTHPAKAYFALDEQAIKVDDPAVEKLNFDLIYGGNSWYLNNWGVIGFSPQGELSRYFSQIYEEPIPTLFKFKQNSEIGYDLKIVINPTLQPSEIAHKVELSENAKFWSVTADVKFINDFWGFKATPLCISTNDDNILAVIDGLDRCDVVKALICSGKTGPDCKSSNADFKKAPLLTITIEGVDFTFTGDEYLFVETVEARKGQINCRWGDVESLRSSDACEEGAEAGIGLKFFEKYPIVLTLDFGKKSTIHFLNSKNDPDNPVYNWGKYILISLGILAFFVAGYLIYKMVFAGKIKKEEDYTEI